MLHHVATAATVTAAVAATAVPTTTIASTVLTAKPTNVTPAAAVWLHKPECQQL